LRSILNPHFGTKCILRPASPKTAIGSWQTYRGRLLDVGF